MARDPGSEETARPPSAEADPGIAETIGPTGRRSARSPGESRLRARIEAQLLGGESFTIGRFEVLGMIGVGGMSVVCRARDPDLDREVAIKLLQGHAAPGDQGRARLQREARAMAKLSHPNVATVFEVGVHEGEVFVAMELVPGQTLRAWRDAHASDQRAIMAMYVAAGEGLAAAHAAGFVHRDFKPDNVMVGDDGRARVLDFGLAAVLGESIARDAEKIEGDLQGTLTMTGALLGTPVYMAPEQHRGGSVDARTDQFAFSVALWEALVGERPFAGATLFEIAAAVTFGTITPPSRLLPAGVEVVLRRGLAVAPSERFPSMRDLLDALADATRPPRGGRTRRGRPEWIATAALSGVLGLGVVVFVLGNRDSADAVATAPRGAPSPAPAASPVASPAPAASPAQAAIDELTRTDGAGIDPIEAFMDREGRRVVYRVGKERWVRDVERTGPELLVWPHRDLVPLAFDADGTGYVGNDGRWLYRVRPGAVRERLAFAPKPKGTIQRVAPDLSALFVYQRERATVQRAGAEPVTVLDGKDVEFASWSADGQRVAAVVRPRDGSAAELVVLDAHGSVLHDRKLPHLRSDALVWLGDTIAMIKPGRVPADIVCFAVDEDGIAAPVVHELDLPPGVGAVARQGSAGGDLLFLTLRTTRDVGVLALADERPELRPLSGDLQANNRLPVWIDDKHLAYVSDRFGNEAVMIDDRRGGKARLDGRFDGDTIACAVAGTAMLCVVEDAEGEGSIVRVEGDGPARRLGPAPGLVAIECADASMCIGVVQPYMGAAEIHAIDPERGTLTRRFPCPPGLQCVPERVALARDGGSIFLVGGGEVHRVDAITGDPVARPLLVAGDRASVQSASELPGGDLVVTTIVTQDERPVYRVVRFHGHVGRKLWESDGLWVIRPRVSPDGRRLALTTMKFHHEAAIAKNPCGIAPPSR